MRRLSMILVAIAIVALFSFSTRDVSAERVLTGSQMESIADTCQSAQTELESLHSFDALMRVNLAQQYDNILTSLISPLNSRLALNQVDTVSLVTTSVDYNDALSDFRKDYSIYEASLRTTIDMDCEQNPTLFYLSLETTRENRQSLHKQVEKLNEALLQYKKDYKEARKNWERNRG